MHGSTQSGSDWRSLVRWMARLGSIASIGIIVAFLPGSLTMPTATEAALLLMFPVGVVAGMLLGWWKEVWGGLLTAASLAGFYGLYMAFNDGVPTGPWFVIFASPGLLFLISGLMRWAGPRGRASLPRTA